MMMSAVRYSSGNTCTVYGGTGSFVTVDSGSNCQIEIVQDNDVGTMWVEEEDIFGETCYHCNSGSTATTMKFYKWPNCTVTSASSSAINYRIRVSRRQRMWCEAGSWFVGEERCVPPKPADRLREIIQARHAPMILTSRKPILTPQDEREIRARETLLRVIGEDKFQKFLKDGFVSVRAKSGLVYQIFPGHGITAVYKDGDQIERLCVVLKGDFPPTDSLIMRYLIILNDEARFRSYAIKHQIITKKPQIVTDERSLTEIFRELKKVA